MLAAGDEPLLQGLVVAPRCRGCTCITWAMDTPWFPMKVVRAG
jgi:hypothetical protein